jgi:hypothetical protein
MANVRSGNSYYIDTASSAGTNLLAEKNLKVTSILFTSDVSGDSITINNLDSAGTGAGAIKLLIMNSEATDTKVVDFTTSPILFSNGIYISALSASCTASIIFSSLGG